jgi:hypothetical protein
MKVGCRAGIRTRIFPVNSRTCCRCHHPTSGNEWSGREDSNLHAPAPEAGGLPITLRPEELSWGERPEHRLPSPTVGLVAGEGIEPPCAVCRTAVLPLNEPAVGRGGGNRTRISRLMRPPRSPSLPSAAVGQQLRAHPGEDNGTRTRTPALTTRRLSLRLCPPQDGPSGGIRTHMNRLLRPMRSVGFEPTA